MENVIATHTTLYMQSFAKYKTVYIGETKCRLKSHLTDHCGYIVNKDTTRHQTSSDAKLTLKWSLHFISDQKFCLILIYHFFTIDCFPYFGTMGINKVEQMESEDKTRNITFFELSTVILYFRISAVGLGCLLVVVSIVIILLLISSHVAVF